MFTPEDPPLDRARVRTRDLGATWLLVALIAAATQLPTVLTAARGEAIHAADLARNEIAMALHAVPKLLHPTAARAGVIAGSGSMIDRSGEST